MSVIAHKTRPRSVLCAAVLTVALSLFLGAGQAFAASPVGVPHAAQSTVVAVAPVKQVVTQVKNVATQARSAAQPVTHPIATAAAPVRTRAAAAVQPVARSAQPVVHAAARPVRSHAASVHTGASKSHGPAAVASAAHAWAAAAHTSPATAAPASPELQLTHSSRHAAHAAAARQDDMSSAAPAGSQEQSPLDAASPLSPLSSGSASTTSFLLMAGLLTALLLMGAPGLGSRIRLAVADLVSPDLALSVERPG
jgi:hypothetical protein